MCTVLTISLIFAVDFFFPRGGKFTDVHRLRSLGCFFFEIVHCAFDVKL